MNKLAKLIGEMSKEEVQRLQRDIQEGNLKRLIQKRLDELEEEHECPVCSKRVGDDAYRLEFGDGMRMEAYFDALDCLQHFIEKLRVSSSSDA